MANWVVFFKDFKILCEMIGLKKFCMLLKLNRETSQIFTPRIFMKMYEVRQKMDNTDP
jgi:hypothetical protein